MNIAIPMRGHCARTLPAITVLIVLLQTNNAGAITSYHVGNSLTWDALAAGGLVQMASDGGKTLDTGYHICCGQRLTYMVANPDTVCVDAAEPYGTYLPALSNYSWDHLTLEPYTGSTTRSEYESAKSMIQPAVADTIYVYQPWPTMPLEGETFYDNWYDPTPINPDTNLLRNKLTYEWVFDALQTDAELSGRKIRTIPVGDVLAEMDQRMRNGQIPGFSSANELYRDNVHLNNAGRFIASSTFYAVIFGESPVGLPVNAYYQNGVGDTPKVDITSELALLLQNAVWDVVSQDPQAIPGPGDLNADGFVGLEDLDLVLTNWNQQLSPGLTQADPSGDAYVGLDDLDILLNNWNTGTSPGSAIPEPDSVLVLGSLLIGLCGYRSRKGLRNMSNVPLMLISQVTTGEESGTSSA